MTEEPIEPKGVGMETLETDKKTSLPEIGTIEEEAEEVGVVEAMTTLTSLSTGL